MVTFLEEHFKKSEFSLKVVLFKCLCSEEEFKEKNQGIILEMFYLA